MSSTAYKLLGYVVWNGGKVYLRRTHPTLLSRRLAAGAGGAALLLAGAGAALVASRARG
jgi:hypothetical protein